MLALELMYCMMLLFILTQVGSKLWAKTATQQAEMLASTIGGNCCCALMLALAAVAMQRGRGGGTGGCPNSE